MSFSLSNRGYLVSCSQPINLMTNGFGFHHFERQYGFYAANNMNIGRIGMDKKGNRFCFQLSCATELEMCNEHFTKWLGKNLDPHLFEKLRTDLQCVYTKKEILYGLAMTTRLWIKEKNGFNADRTNLNVDHEDLEENHTFEDDPNEDEDEDEEDEENEMLPSTFEEKEEEEEEEEEVEVENDSKNPNAEPKMLPLEIQLEIRKFIWEFVDYSSWKIDIERLYEVFEPFDPHQTGQIQPVQLKQAMTTHGHRVRLDAMAFDRLFQYFAVDKDFVDYKRMIETLRPQMKKVEKFHYEIYPILDPITQSITSVQVLLTQR
jgi:hypothetical protein